ncbi:uncharacterized protein [Dysidea avara]
MSLKHLLFVLTFIIWSFYFSDAGISQPTLKVCVSYNETDPFLNAKWNVQVFDERMGAKSNITYFNITKMSEGFKFTNISLRGLPLTGSLLRVRSCIKTSNGIHCQTTLPVVQLLYNVVWKRVNSTSIQFTCEVACRTEIIVGCAVTLTSGQEMVFGNSLNVEGSLTAFQPRSVTVNVHNINSDLQYSYSASALIEESAISPNLLKGFVPPSTRTQSISVQEAATSAFSSVVPSTVSSSSAITTTDYYFYFKPTSTPSTDGKNDNDSDSMKSQSTIVIVIVITAIALPLCVTLAVIIAVVVSRKYFIQKSQNATISVSAPINNDITTDVNMQENPAYHGVKQTYLHNKDTDYYYI